MSLLDHQLTDIGSTKTDPLLKNLVASGKINVVELLLAHCRPTLITASEAVYWAFKNGPFTDPTNSPVEPTKENGHSNTYPLNACLYCEWIQDMS